MPINPLVKYRITPFIIMLYLMAKETKNIYEKLLEFQNEWISFERSSEVKVPTKNWWSYKYYYTTLDDINAKIKPILSRIWLVIVHSVAESKVNTTIFNAENPDESISCVIELPHHSDPQKLWGAITYFKRYNTVALLNLDSESDNDGQGTKPEKIPFDEVEKKKFKESLVSETFALPETKEELYTKLETRYMLTKENKEELAKLYIINENK